MAEEQVLSQDEIDALLQGVDDGSVDTDGELSKKDIHQYQLGRDDYTHHGRLPALSMINERFVRESRISWFNFLQGQVEIQFNGLQIERYSDLTASIKPPANMNIVKFNPLKGKSLIVFDTNLVFGLVELFFGGGAKSQKEIVKREFTETELRIVKRVIEHILKDVKVAWGPIVDLDCHYESSEINPLFVSITAPNDYVFIHSYTIVHQEMKGEIQIIIPYTSLEPYKEKLGHIKQIEKEQDNASWKSKIKHQMLNVSVPLTGRIAESTISLKQVMSFNVGDIIPIKMSSKATVYVEGVPTFESDYGNVNGNVGLKISGHINKH